MKLSSSYTQGKCFSCIANTKTLCLKQKQSVSTFMSQKTENFFNISHALKGKNEYNIYFMEITLCN